MNLIIIDILTPLTLIQRMNLLMKISIRRLQKSEYFFYLGKNTTQRQTWINWKGPFWMAIGHCVRLPVIGTILSWPILFWPINLQGLTLVQLKRLRSYVMYIPFCVKDIKISIRKYKDGTFPFYSSFIKVETDLMCIRRNSSFCVLSPNKVAKKRFYYTGSHPTPFFALTWQQISLQLAKRSF